MMNSKSNLRAKLLLLCLLLPFSLRAANAPSGLLCELLEHPEETVITADAPKFGWIYNPSARGDAQSAFQLIVASSSSLADQGRGDIWDSGFVTNANSINISYAGPALRSGTDYFWRVKTGDNTGRWSSFSATQHFRKAGAADPSANRYPLRYESVKPVFITNTAPGRWFVDFGKDAFGYATMHLNGGFQWHEHQRAFWRDG